jgi:hypothetical protein
MLHHRRSLAVSEEGPRPKEEVTVKALRFVAESVHVLCACMYTCVSMICMICMYV